ncbi:anthranilate phosphoribosyltransferase [Permianibacter sp. IMCC34836]|uniref:anthranilate phosphoribosyltransferase n=1 Tax=Permianibacter fluminis TaxID=2738515 RepID=UPI001555164D|nr:anthranilate phosphoribosyltransferase [Permianibacter fluminis]NQD38366.1 anthranilate phosphoribosyltransferase [Permianibacter fluminis]
MNPVLERVVAGADLSVQDAEQAFTRIVRGEADVIEISALLIALRTKGETAEEVAGAARALLAAAVPFATPAYDVIDCCGTGGDGMGTLNVSTAVAFTLASLGVPVAKHGNRAVSSQSGSTDVLKALGIQCEQTPERARALLDEHRLCFLHAPQYHPGVRHAMPVRQALKLRTLFNLLGPIINPARATLRLMGVYDAKYLPLVAETLREIGVSRAIVVNGGVDEFAVHGPSQYVELRAGQLTSQQLSPEQVGLALHPIAALRGGDAAANAAEIVAVLQGGGRAAFRNAIALNAGAGLYVANQVSSIAAGVQQVLAALRDGLPAQTLQTMQRECPYVG